MKIDVIESDGIEFITDLGESVDAHTAAGEQFYIPRYGLWRYRQDGKAECIATGDSLDEIHVEWVNHTWEKPETKT